jgi:hypothetical protein
MIVLIKDSGNLQGAHNTPANEQWTLSVEYTPENETSPLTAMINFLPTGEIDLVGTSPGDLLAVDEILLPAIRALQDVSVVTGLDLDIWKIINWFVVSSYWTILADLGQISPTTYTPLSSPLYNRDDLSTAIRHPSTNNIFVNETLFNIYSDYLINSILPLLNITAPRAGFAPLDDQNRLISQDTTFKRSYSCTVRKWKSPLPAIVSILVAEYAFLRGAYSLFIFLAAWYQKRKMREGIPFHSMF